MRKNNSVICPLCNEGEFREYRDGRFTFFHGKKKYVVEDQSYAKCNLCGAKGFIPGQQAENHQVVSDFQKSIPDYVSPSDVLAVRERYSLTQRQASQIFKGGVNGFSKWERGVTFPSGATAMLIKAALVSAEAMRTFADIAHVGFPIVDHAAPVISSEQNNVLSTPLLFVATHEEYCDEVTAGNDDSELDNENGKLWTTVHTGSTKLTSFHN
ncbi:MAG: type II toxin-antitoxin system MqsA family antitoxin [Pseudomonadota bacterium]|nr:type II toxin-antitoxin system MqsA family antitoxin [Pseudomonadota bacterium]